MIYKVDVSDMLKDLIRVLPLLPYSFSVSVQLGFTMAQLSFSCLSSLLVFCHSERCWMGSEVWRTEARLSPGSQKPGTFSHTYTLTTTNTHTHTSNFLFFSSLSLFFMNLNAWGVKLYIMLITKKKNLFTPESQNHVSID